MLARAGQKHERQVEPAQRSFFAGIYPPNRIELFCAHDVLLWMPSGGAGLGRMARRKICKETLIYFAMLGSLNSDIISPQGWDMQFHSDIKPISWLKNNAKQLIESVDETGNPMIITQNGEAKAVVMNVREYDQMQESLAMLRMLADSSADVEAGRVRDSDEVFADARRMIAEMRNERS